MNNLIMINRESLILLLLALFVFSCSSVNKNILNESAISKIKKIEFKSENKELNDYVNLLSLSDENSLILKTEYWSYWTKGTIYADYIVYQNDGKVFIYNTALSATKKEIKKKRIISSKKKSIYWSFLDGCISGNRFDINQNRLNLRKKYNDDGTFSTILVSDGQNYSFEITQGKKSTVYHTYSPDSYIRSKSLGWKERKKLVELIKDFDSLIPKYLK